MANSLEAIATCIAFDSRDWSLAKRDAWIYGIVLGWGEALPEIQAKHELSDEMIVKMEGLRIDYQNRMREVDPVLTEVKGVDPAVALETILVKYVGLPCTARMAEQIVRDITAWCRQFNVEIEGGESNAPQAGILESDHCP